jgi:hypothetical protein
MSRFSFPLVRLLTDLETGAAEEKRLAARKEWVALSGLLTRELVLVHRLARERQCANPAPVPDLPARIAALLVHYAHMHALLAAARGQAGRRLNELGEAGRRVRAVRRAYQAGAA